MEDLTLDLRAILGDSTNVKGDGFTGAIFTTFTLDLSFFEQLVVPKLNQSRCSNIIVIADPDGYQGALELRASGVSGVGQDYLCVPVDRTGGGIQHTKMALLVGPTQGKLLLGSGNLTMHGYGRNLELFSCFEFEQDHSSDSLRYPFVVVWEFLQQLARDNRLTAFTNQQLELIGATARWLHGDVEPPSDFRVWHNFRQPIWDQLLAWRTGLGLDAHPVELIQIVSPYYDKDGSTLRKISRDINATQVNVYLHQNSTNFNGESISRHWNQSEVSLHLNEIHAKSIQNANIARPLHAKAIIAREKTGVWCISGSANISRPGLTHSWLAGGNLEMVSFKWSEDPTAFDYLLADPILHIEALNIDEIQGVEEEPSERIIQTSYSITIKEAVIRGRTLEGSISKLPADCPLEGTLHFLRSGIQVKVELHDYDFSVQLPEVLSSADAIQLKLGPYVTSYRWVDYPDLLLKRGARSYHGRVRSQLETIDGTQNLFVELMDFLWMRVDPALVNRDEQRKRSRVLDRKKVEEKDEKEVILRPEDFIVPESEVVNHLARRLEDGLPYDRSTWGLRDLLSIVLLRLTMNTETSQATDYDVATRKRNENEILKIRQIKAREYLRSYLLDYCKQYGQRLADSEFVEKTGMPLLFENTFTLGRVLLNFANSVEEFSQDDLVRCTLFLWAPLVWPSLLDIKGKPTISVLNEISKDVASQWAQTGLPTLGAILFTKAFSNPLSNWQAETQIQHSIVLRHLIEKIQNAIGGDCFTVDNDDLQDIYLDMSWENHEHVQTDIEGHATFYMNAISTLKTYRSPAELKYSAILNLQKLLKSEKPDELERQKYVQEIEAAGMSNLLKEFLNSHIPILSTNGDHGYCPRCFGQLSSRASSDLKNGNMVLCTVYSDALIYHVPRTPSKWEL